jgi:chromosome segregation ATPase
MERKVARAQGQRSQEEETKLKGDIKKNSDILDKHKEELKLLVTSNKKLQDERRNIERAIAKIRTQQDSLASAL